MSVANPVVDISSNNQSNTTATTEGSTRTPVTVDLIASIDISGNVQVFSTSGTTIYDVVVCSEPLAASALYTNNTTGILEFVEPSGERGTIRGAVSSPNSVGSLHTLDGWTSLRNGVNSGLHTVTTGVIDASNSRPFDGYTTDEKYYKFASFGDLVLAMYANYLFGHPAATAAIANDEALVAYINNNATGARLGFNLAAAIENLSDADATTIVRQVISQDPNRALGQDNNALAPEVHQALEFVGGDTIYLTIVVQAPSISLSATGAPTGSEAVNLTTAGAYPVSAPSFTLQITLS